MGSNTARSVSLVQVHVQTYEPATPQLAVYSCKWKGVA